LLGDEERLMIKKAITLLAFIVLFSIVLTNTIYAVEVNPTWIHQLSLIALCVSLVVLLVEYTLLRAATMVFTFIKFINSKEKK